MSRRKLWKLLSTVLTVIVLAIMLPTSIKGAQTASDSIQSDCIDASSMQTGYQQPVGIDMGVKENLQGNRTGVGATTYAASNWDTYSSDYFYNQMSTAQQSFYNNLYTVCMKLLIGTYTANSETYATQTGDSRLYYMTDYAAAGSLSSAEAQYVVILFQTNNPQFYFVNDMFFYSYDYSGHYSYALGVYDDFINGATRASYSSQIKNIITSWVSTIKNQTDVIAMERKAHDLVIANTIYSSGTYNQSCAGVFLDGEAVCAGYAEAYELLCNAVGIETIAVTSNSHEWNKTKLYGRWYVVDCTWDDQYETDYTYFNKSDEAVSAGDGGVHTYQSFWSEFNVPTAVLNTVNTSSAEVYIYNGVDYSAAFDGDYYLENYGDLRAAYGNNTQAALVHFVNYGMAEGRQGSVAFNVLSYRAQYKDLRLAFGNNLLKYYLHYINYGKSEGRAATGTTVITDGTTVYNGIDYAAVYNYSYYIEKNQDIAKAFLNDDISVLVHFVNYGMSEGRRAIASFDVESYRAQNKDLRVAYGNNLAAYYQHYMSYGRYEDRATTGTTAITDGVTVYDGVDYAMVYNYSYYIKKNSDIEGAYPNDDIGALAHFVNCGMSEGRQAIPSFKLASYRAQNKDLRMAYGNDFKAYYQHYMSYGRYEGRPAVGTTVITSGVTIYNGVDYATVYNYGYYIEKNPDIAKAFPNDDISALAHFVNYGMSEGRVASSDFQLSVYANNYEDLRVAFGSDRKLYYMHYLTTGKYEGRVAKE